MSLKYQVLGAPTRDNALLVTVDSGQSVTRLLFDCGGGCLDGVRLAEIQAIDHLFFSHLHMDHVCGFDSFFRAVYARDNRPNHIWGPPRTAEILHHRLQGYMWNLQEGAPGCWRVHDVGVEAVRTTRFDLADGFQAAHDEGERPRGTMVWEDEVLAVESITLDHLVPSLGYVVREKTRRNIDTGKLAELGLAPGSWLQDLKDGVGEGEIEVEGRSLDRVSLLWQLIVETPGDSVAYQTDFRLQDQAALEQLADFLRGCRAIVCEGKYRHDDLEQARKNHHLTAVQSATVARLAGAEKLVLFHLSDRYGPEAWLVMLAEAWEVFAGAALPVGWG